MGKSEKRYQTIYRSTGGVPSSHRASCAGVVLAMGLAVIGMIVLVGLLDVVLAAGH